MQEVVQPEDYINGRINLRLVFDQDVPTVVNSISQPKGSASWPAPEDKCGVQQPVTNVLPSVSDNNVTPFAGNKQIPQAILQGNYRGGLSEYLMKDPATRNHRISFNTTTISGAKNVSFQTTVVLILGGNTHQATAVGSSKKSSVHNAAKEMLVRLGVIPKNYYQGQNISNPQITCSPMVPLGNNSNSGAGGFNQGAGGFNQGGFNQAVGGFNQSYGYNQGSLNNAGSP